MRKKSSPVVVVNPYAALGVSAADSDMVIRNAYYALARKMHPDKGGSADEFAALAGAYRLVRNAEARAGYRAMLQLTGASCASCAGEGATRYQRGFTQVVLTPCKRCYGAGFTF